MSESTIEAYTPPEEVCGEHTLPNGRTYRVVDTGKPYTEAEYPSGGFKIDVRLPSGNWGYIDHSPAPETVRGFLKAAARLPQEGKT